MSDRFHLRALHPDEAEAAARRMQLSFGATGDMEAAIERFRDRAAEGVVYVLVDDASEEVVGQAILRDGHHWFAGGKVLCQRVGAVAVSPEHRGAGVASALMAEALRVAERNGVGLSLLFPANGALYRRAGYECAGTHTRWRIEARHVPAAGAPLRPLSDEWEAVEACYAQFAATLNGPQVREEDRWSGYRSRTQFAYGLDGEQGLEAYLLIEHVAIPNHWQHTLGILDWAYTSPRGLEAIVGFVGRHGTLAKDATFVGPTPSPWALCIPEQDLDRDSDFDWMARGVDPPGAIAARGFPAGLDLSVTVAVDDPILEGARGPWRLKLSGGRAVLEPAATADVRLDVTAFGPLYTGYRSASELAAAGRATGSPEALRLLDAAFAGSTPTLLDFF